MDKDKNPDETASFWRCSHCGSRFMGPRVREGRHRHRSRSALETGDPLDRQMALVRKVKRWLFPVLAILCTILALMYVLEQRDRPPEQIVFPGD